MLNAIRYARETGIPYFGICLGMQTACIEYARNVCGLKDANSGEFDPATPYRIIYKLRELTGVEEMGGTMRLGAWACVLEPDSLAAEGLRRHRNLRAPPPPLRVQSRVRSHPHRRRPAHHRHHSRRHLRRDRRDPQPPLLPRLPVPPRIQIQAARAAPALPRLRRRQLPEPRSPQLATHRNSSRPIPAPPPTFLARRTRTIRKSLTRYPRQCTDILRPKRLDQR